MPNLEELIAEQLRAAERSGELQASPHYGKPLDLDDGFMETPIELRVPFKLLKESGFVPHEVVMMRELAELKKQLAALSAKDDPQGDAEVLGLRRRVVELQQQLALRLERLRVSGTL